MTRHAVNFINTNGAMIIHLLLCRVNSLDETVITASLLQADDMSKHLNAQSGTSSLDNFVHKLIVKCNREVSIFLLPKFGCLFSIFIVWLKTVRPVIIMNEISGRRGDQYCPSPLSTFLKRVRRV